MRVITVKIPEGIERKLNSLCKETTRSKSFFIREALNRFLGEEAIYRKALDRLNDSKDKIITAEEMSQKIK